MLPDLMEPNGCDTATLGAIRIAAKLARTDSRLQIRGDCASGLGKNTIIRTGWRIQKTFDYTSGHIELRIDFAQLKQVLNNLSTSRSRQDFVARFADLRRKQAHPNLPNLIPLRPEIHKVTKIPRTRRHLPCNRAVDGNLVAANVLQNAIVSCRFAARVVFRWESVNGYDDFEFVELIPFQRDFSYGARYHVRAYSPGREARQDFVQFPESDKRFATDNRNMQRPMGIDELHKSMDEFSAFIVAHLPEHDAPAEMFAAVRIASRATQWTLFRDFNRQGGCAACEDRLPSAKDFGSFHKYDITSPTCLKCKSHAVHERCRWTC